MLVVDDDRMIRTLLQNGVSAERGVRTVAAADGEEGLLRAWDLGPAVVLALGLELFVAGDRVVGPRPAAAVGGLAAFGALCCWYGPGLRSRGSLWPSGAREEDAVVQGTGLETRIKNVMTEVRVVVPGVQGLLGFQLAAVLMDGFDKLPALSQRAHLASLVAVAVSAVLLDMRMPVMDGWAFAREARRRGHGFAIVVMTAAENARRWAAEVAADAALPKRFDIDDLFAVVERYCAAA